MNPPMYRCLHCSFESIFPWRLCPKCDRLYHQPSEYHVDSEFTEGEDSLAEVPLEPIRSIRTQTALDEITGEGLPQGAVVVLWGLEGTGKSRLALCAADGWCGTSQGRAVYVLNESMSVTQLRRMAAEHGLRNLWSILPAQVDLIDPAMYQRRAPGPYVYVIDSTDDAQVIIDAKAHVSSERGADDTVLVLVQATKDEDFKGPRAMVHEADVVIQLQVISTVNGTLAEPLVEEYERWLDITKNRFGAAGIVPCPWPPR